MLIGSQRKGNAMGLRIGVGAPGCVSVALIIFWAALQAQMSVVAAAGAPLGAKANPSRPYTKKQNRRVAW